MEYQSMILGLFYTGALEAVQEKTQSQAYGFGVCPPKDFPQVMTEGRGKIVLKMVHFAGTLYKKINFVLDGIRLPLNAEESITCGELKLILMVPELLDKTTFWLNGKEQDKSKVLSIIKTVQDNELTFDNLDLESFNL